MLLVSLLYAVAYIIIDVDRAPVLGWSWGLALATAIGALGLHIGQLLRTHGESLETAKATRRRALAALGDALLLASAALALALALRAGLRPLEAAGVALPGLATPAAVCLNALGIDALGWASWLHIEGLEDQVSVAVGVDKLALIPLLLLTALWALRLDRRLRWSALPLALFGLWLVLLGRLVVIGVLIGQEGELLNSGSGELLLSIVGSRSLALGTVAVWAGILNALPRQIETGNVGPALGWCASLGRPAVWLAGASLVALWISYHIDLPGPVKSGKLMFDDRHAESWGRCDRQMNTSWYGDYSSYNLSSVVEWLGHHYPTVVNRDRLIDRQLLADVAVLVIKTPQFPFEDSELEAIHQWVSEGGGLLAIGDHTDLHGMNTHLNRVLSPYGIHFNFDAVSDAADGSFNRYRRSKVEPAPSSICRVRELAFMTGCSIATTTWPRLSLIAPRCSRDAGDYSRGSNFGTRRSDPSQPVGPAILALGKYGGDGRVLALSDGTIFSGFCAFQDGHDELLREGIAWLYREAWPLGERIRNGIFLLLAIALVVGFRRSVIGPALALAGPGFLLAGLNLDWYHSWAFKSPPPDDALKNVDILWIGGACGIPSAIGASGGLKPNLAFDTLATNIARTGLWPKIRYEYPESIGDEIAAVFIINPIQVPPKGYLDALDAYVRRGGTLVVLDPKTSHAGNGSSDEILARLGLMAADQATDDQQHAGLRALQDRQGRSEIAWQAITLGQGKVHYARASDDYSRVGIGHSFTLPDASRRQLLSDLYQLLQECTDFDIRDRRTYDIAEAGPTVTSTSGVVK